jgi:ubiquinone/menaquinone biosynthesis C-methylase UbiE
MNPVDWDDFSKKGLLRAVIDPSDSRGAKNVLIDHLHWRAFSRHLVPQKRLLDFGCGTGRFAARIVECGLEYVGVDASEGMIQAARSHNPGLAACFSVLKVDAPLPFPDGTFDFCLTTWVLQYLIKTPALDHTLREFRRVLRPGGHVIFLEQVSQSQRTSGTVSNSATESDYRDALANDFQVGPIERVRTNSFTRIARRMIKRCAPDGLLIRMATPLIARYESCKIRHASDAYLRSLDYYDVIIKATRN